MIQTSNPETCATGIEWIMLLATNLLWLVAMLVMRSYYRKHLKELFGLLQEARHHLGSRSDLRLRVGAVLSDIAVKMKWVDVTPDEERPGSKGTN